MCGLGSGENGEFTFLDIISIISFLVGLQNLDMNITQEDMQNTTEKLDRALRIEVADIHNHLQEQDKKIDKLLEILSNRKEQI